MTKTLDRNALAARLRYQISASEGTARFNGTMPDLALCELFPEVASALEAFEATQEEARALKVELRKAIAKRAAHKISPDAVYTNDRERGLIFTDPTGVALQNAVREIEKKLSALGAKSKSALQRYLVEAFSRTPDAKDAFRARAIEADEAAKDLAEKLTKALADRERMWALAGKPYPGVSAAALPAVQSRRTAEQEQHARTLPELLTRVLTFPSL